MVNFTRAAKTLQKHNATEDHNASMVRAEMFRQTMGREQPTILQQLHDQKGQQAAENRKKLLGLISTIEFCGRQNIALRGHRSETWNPSSDELPDSNPGNFLALLQFRHEAGDLSVQQDFHTIPGCGSHSTTYRSPQVQNELVECCGEVILESVLEEVRAAPFYSVLADEAADVSNQEQMALVVRFVDKDNNIREEFLGFAHCDSGTSGRALAAKIQGNLRDWGLPLQNLRGQGYDGASNMSGHLNGCAKAIQEQQPEALYFHCASHLLNLAVVSMTTVQPVRNMWDVLKQLCLFLHGSPKRHGALKQAVQETDVILETDKRQLVGLNPTRWVERHDALVTFNILYPAVLVMLEDMSLGARSTEKWNADTASTASSLLNAITSFSFIVAFQLTSKVMSFLHALTISLQGESKDICNAYMEVDRTMQVLQDIRQNVDVRHTEWWTDVERMAEQASVQPSKPRTCRRQQHRGVNIDVQSVSDYWRVAVTVPLLDELLGHLKDRFSPLQQSAAKGMALLPDKFGANPVAAKQAKVDFARAFPSALPVGTNVDTLKADLDRWHLLLQDIPEKPKTVTAALALAESAMCPCIANLLKLVATWPVTTCSCERSISALRRLKTYLRSTMSQTRLRGLALLHVHGYRTKLDKEKVLERFLHRHARSIII